MIERRLMAVTWRFDPETKELIILKPEEQSESANLFDKDSGYWKYMKFTKIELFSLARFLVRCSQKMSMHKKKSIKIIK